MLDDNTSSQSTTSTQTSPNGQATAVAQNQNNINVTVRLEQPRGRTGRRAASPANTNATPGQAQPEPIKKDEPSVDQVNGAGAAVGAAASVSDTPTTPGVVGTTTPSASPAGALPVQEWVDNDGHRTQQLRDNAGGTVTIRHDADGRATVWFGDSNSVINTTTRASGFVRVRGASDSFLASAADRAFSPLFTNGTVDAAVEFYDGWTGDGPLIDCRSNQPLRRNWNWVADSQIDEVTRGEVQQFLSQHPQLQQTLRGMNVAVTELNDQLATVDQVFSAPAPHRACPANHSDRLIDIVR